MPTYSERKERWASSREQDSSSRESSSKRQFWCARRHWYGRIMMELPSFANKLQETTSVGKRLPFCAFNGKDSDICPYGFSLTPRLGGSDVFIDIGDKSWGVLSCQRYFGGIDGNKSLHVGDQFLSIGANDFKVGRFPHTNTGWTLTEDRLVLHVRRHGLQVQQRQWLCWTRSLNFRARLVRFLPKRILRFRTYADRVTLSLVPAHPYLLVSDESSSFKPFPLSCVHGLLCSTA